MTPHPLNPWGLIGREEEEEEEEEECVGEGMGGDGGIYTSRSHAGTTLHKHNTDTIQKYTKQPDTYTHVCAHVCSNTKTEQEVAVRGWTQADVNENDGKWL